MPHFSIGIWGTTVAAGEACFDRGVSVTHEARRGSRKRARRHRGALARSENSGSTSAQCNRQDDRRERADADPHPLLVCEAGRLHLIQVLRKLMQILTRELRNTLVHLLLREAMSSEDRSHLVVGYDVADNGDVGGASVEALVRDSLRGRRRCERRNCNQRYEREKNDGASHEISCQPRAMMRISAARAPIPIQIHSCCVRPAAWSWSRFCAS